MNEWRPSIEAFLRENKLFFLQLTKRYCGFHRVPHLAEDVFQEAVVVLIKKWPDKLSEPPDKWCPRAFMCGTLRNLANRAGERYRAEGRRRGPHAGDEPGSLVTDQVSTEDLVLAEFARREIYAAIRSLSPQQRQIVELRKIGELSTRQVAQHLGLRETDVTTSMNKAKKKLRSLLPHELIAEFENAHPNFMLSSEGGGVA